MHAEGKTVHAYGAPAKGATLLNAFGIGPRLVQYAAEKNPLKFGRLIPGARIPIVEEGSVPAPDAYLVLAWNFIDEFLARERRYLENGGAFIVPVPELKVITAADLPKASERGCRLPILLARDRRRRRCDRVRRPQPRRASRRPCAALIAVSPSGRAVPGAHEAARFDALEALSVPADAIVVNVAAQRYDAEQVRDGAERPADRNAEITNRLYRFCLTKGIREVRAASSVAVYPRPSIPSTTRRLSTSTRRPTRTRPSTHGRSAGRR